MDRRRPSYPPLLRMAPAAAIEPPVASPRQPALTIPPLRSPRALPFSPLTCAQPPSPLRTPVTRKIDVVSPSPANTPNNEYDVERESRKLARLIEEGELVLFVERLGPALARLEPNDQRALLAAGRARAKKAADRAYRRLAALPPRPLGSPCSDVKPPTPRTPRTPLRTPAASPRSQARARDPRTPLRAAAFGQSSRHRSPLVGGVTKMRSMPNFSIGSSPGR